MRIARIKPSDLKLLQSKTLSTVDRDFHHETLHLFPQNAHVNVNNQKLLEAINGEMCVVPVIDILWKNVSSQRIKEALD